MGPLLILACILVGILGNLWLLFGMPFVAPFGIAICFSSKRRVGRSSPCFWIIFNETTC